MDRYMLGEEDNDFVCNLHITGIIRNSMLYIRGDGVQFRTNR